MDKQLPSFYDDMVLIIKTLQVVYVMTRLKVKQLLLKQSKMHNVIDQDQVILLNQARHLFMITTGLNLHISYVGNQLGNISIFIKKT